MVDDSNNETLDASKACTATRTREKRRDGLPPSLRMSGPSCQRKPVPGQLHAMQPWLTICVQT